ncbi:hypothetical protein, partial [Alcanivorax sp.]|uniref:hypothetical protein n=1 Tax=Alcanivorax sp. TaxID=1872427 RepID=UPI0025BBE6BB
CEVGAILGIAPGVSTAFFQKKVRLPRKWAERLNLGQNRGDREQVTSFKEQSASMNKSQSQGLRAAP